MNAQMHFDFMEPLFEAVKDTIAGKKPSALALDFPGVDEGVRGMLFIETVVASNKSKQKWTAMKK